MSKANDSGADESVKEGLGKLASPIQDVAPAEVPGEVTSEHTVRWQRAKRVVRWSVLFAGAFACLGCFAVAGIFFSNPTIRQIFIKITQHPGTMWRNGKFDLTGAYNLADHFPSDKRKSITVLLLGVDHDYGGKRSPGHVAVPVITKNTPGRSDAIMVAKFEFDGDAVSSVNILSIPRDSRVRVPGHGIHKINAAYAYGGPELSVATIRDVFGIDPDYYVDVNFEGFQQVVDAIGGVDVNVHQPLDYDDNWGNLHVHLKPGPQHLNGYRAMGYVRIRHSDSDLMRAQRQHEFIEALRSRIVSPGTFLKLPAVVGTITNNLHSNLTMDQMLTLANLARKAPKDAICLETLPVIQGKIFVYIDKRKSAGLIHKMFFRDKQVADLNINTPDTEAVPAHRRRRRMKEGGTVTDIRRHRSPRDTPVGDGLKSDDTSAAPALHETEMPVPSGADRPEKPDTSDRPADTPKTENTSGTDGSKTPTKGKDGTGTSYGGTSTVLRS